MRQVPVLSFNAISQFKRCGGAYFRSYIDPMRKLIVKEEDRTGTLPGIVVNEIADRALESAKGQKGLVTKVDLKKFSDHKLRYAIFKSTLEADKNISLHKRDEPIFDWAENEQTALAFLKELSENLLHLITVHELIKPFMLRQWWFGQYNSPLILNDQLKVCGALDLLTAEDRGSPARLIDYKAAFTDYRLDKDQLKLYWMAAEKEGFTVGMAAFLLFRVKRAPIYERFDKEELQETEDRFVTYSKQIQNEEFDYAPSKTACKLCSHRFECPSAVLLEETKQKAPKLNPNVQLPVWEQPDL